MADRISVLMVCTGNICRSPTAEGVLRHKILERGLGDRIAVRSAGTHDYHVGEPPDPRALRHGAIRGYDFSAQRAMVVDPRNFDEYDFILAMDRGHLRALQQLAPPGSRARVGLFLDASSRWHGQDVPDPYYGGAEGFDMVLDMVEEGTERWLNIFEAELDPGTFRLEGSP